MANILILGGGFGGLTAARRLTELLPGDEASKHRITIVSPRNKFTFYPALVRLAFGDCTPDDLTFDLVEKLNALDVRSVEGEAIKINFSLRRVQVAGKDFNGEMLYDFLIIASGRRLATEKIGGFFEHAHHLLGVESALKFGEAVKNFVAGHIVCGIAPNAFLPVPACETAFSLAQLFSEEIARKEVRVSILFPDTIKAAFGGADLHEKLKDAFAKRHIELINNFPVKEITEKTLLSADGQSLDYDLLMLVPPFGGKSILGKNEISDKLGFIETDNFLRVQNLEKVYAVGDIAAFPGPKLAFMAIRQAEVAAENIASEIRGDIPRNIYNHDLAVIIDEAGADAIFLHYGIWDATLRQLKEGKMWSRLKKSNNYLRELLGKP